ncbi:hypothetical protein P692DRAFT_20750382 [Suillus brevipes Sb2]|nr:hypothetical protein P692DRAFT_20750382 [Suillus brevipes Sb2]
MLFLSPYSPDLTPDLTPIEESFSAVKAFIRHHADKLRQHHDPVFALMEATSCIMAEKAYGWFKNAGYIVA